MEATFNNNAGADREDDDLVNVIDANAPNDSIMSTKKRNSQASVSSNVQSTSSGKMSKRILLSLERKFKKAGFGNKDSKDAGSNVI